MRKLVLGCALVALVALSMKTEAQPPASFDRTLTSSVVRLGRSQLGVASWYGEEFQGTPTASGEPFDMNGLTAAHPTLPLGSKIILTNLNNHKSLVLRVNDRGPNVADRLVDVSRAAAKRLGFLGAGVTRVRVRPISMSKGLSTSGFQSLGSCATLIR